MGAIVGLMLACGVLLLVTSDGGRVRDASTSDAGWALDRLARQSGIVRLTGARVIGICVAAGVLTGALALALTALPVAALLAMACGAAAPIALLRRRVLQRRQALRRQWPDAIDALLSAVRAGMSLPESLCALAVNGPAMLRPAFAEFAVDYRAAGSFDLSLGVLSAQLADPVADRVISALRIARDVGGTELGTVLRTLSGLLRDEARVRCELEARQGWTVNAARLAVCAPWLTLALLSTRPETIEAYRTPVGTLILVTAAAVSLLAYRLMLWIGRLPEEERVVRA